MLEEYVVFAGLLLAMWGLYILLTLHYMFAFSLVKNTSISEDKKQKIEKIKVYVFAFLKVLFFISLIAMFAFGSMTLMEGESLKALVFDLWQSIPKGFWLHLLLTLFRIALLIVLMRYVLKYIFRFLEKQEVKSISKNTYHPNNIRLVYLRIYNTIKFTVVLAVIYRIIHFFPFLEEVSHIFLFALVFFVIVALMIVLKETLLMLKTRI